MPKKPRCDDAYCVGSNGYSGSSISNVKVLESSSIKPDEFFKKYVSKRVPVVLNGHIIEKSWKGSKWTNAYIRKACGSAVVRVEHRQDSNDHFGKGQEKTMTINNFLDLIESKNENVYMTTQELTYSPEGQPSIISPPLTLLRDDFPLTPQSMNSLIVSNINVWFGASKDPTTSGLHHDFHDNLYILLRGEKHFTLYSPAEALNMYTVGEIVKVHPNGRINYKGQPTRADGADEGIDAAVRAAERMAKATAKLEEVEAKVDADGFDAALINEAEDDVDEALEALLDAEMAANCGEDGDDSEEGGDSDLEDDFEEEEGDFEDFSEGDESIDYNDNEDEAENDLEDSDEEESKDERKKKGKGKVNIKEVAKFLGLGKRKQPESSSSSSAGAADNKKATTSTSSTPSNFSRVDTSLSDAELQSHFPLFLQARQRSISLTLKAGQMLYLPAGWFHEVRSQGSAESGGHLAFNYWFHPPDGAEYCQPYTSDFWAKDLAERLKSGNI